MSELIPSAEAVVVGSIAALLLLLDLVLTVSLVAASSLSRVALQRLSADTGDARRVFLKLKQPHSSHRTAIHLARQLSLLGGCVALGWLARGLGWPTPWALGPLGGAVIGVLLLESLVARGIALRDARAALRLTAWLVRGVHAAFYPLAVPLARALELAHRPNGRDDEREGEDQEEDVEALIEVGEREGIFEAEEGEMIRSIADLDETRVREIMTARTDIVSLPIETTVGEARRALIEAAHSRLPVYRGTIDEVVGVLHARDLFRAWEARREDAPIADYLRPALFVPETLTVAELLAKIRVRTSMAMVVDEYGGIAGLATLEDLLEEIVGDIRDEHDLEEALVLQQEDGAWLISGLAHVRELEELFDIDIAERDFDTVGGLVVAGFGRVPKEGEKLSAYGLDFEILESDPKRVYQVRVRASGTPRGVAAES